MDAPREERSGTHSGAETDQLQTAGSVPPSPAVSAHGSLQDSSSSDDDEDDDAAGAEAAAPASLPNSVRGRR